ncbi:DUF2959 domain-containing protein [Amphritea balenae]|uniref:DUF2959 domain-containing protein n=1 Tax=Amphritea balenae TaxID=452629 RepID=A0A3P1SRH0_9GAMM|nr:DUF2959 domain-containing protein [Amphritea balenae]RRC99690.1 DUF2959 domain-containing protein [Amphritea balenae]GGK79012.1 DNA repair ATPase [Amphritea balenae]
MKRLVLTCVMILAMPLFSGCQSAYYSAMEQVGIHKRDILVDRVEDTRNAQDEAQQEFVSALEQFRSVVNFDGGELEKVYSEMQGAYDDSAAAAENVTDNIRKVEDVSEALFDEWEEELDQYTSAKLRSQSARTLRDTKQRYKTLHASLKRAESKMQPVLNALLDNTLYLKHNLNARAIGSLKGEFGGIKRDIDRLVAEMQKSIKASDQFIKEMKQ